jgi:hypothetical protein
MIKNPHLSISDADVEKIKDFIKNNKEILLKLSDMEIDFDEFMKNMKTGKEVPDEWITTSTEPPIYSNKTISNKNLTLKNANKSTTSYIFR